MEKTTCPMRVAMISEHGDPLAPLGGQQAGGQNVYVYELARALSDMGIRVDVFTRWENRKTAQQVRFAAHAKVIRLKAGPRQFVPKEKFGPLMPEFVERVLEYTRTKKVKYDVIHSHYYYSGWAGLQIKQILNIPLVSTFHSLGSVKKKILKNSDASPDTRIDIEQSIFSGADYIIATSPEEKITMAKSYDVKADNVVVIPAGVNLHRFFPVKQSTARTKLGLPLDRSIVVFAGKAEPRKGAITLIEAVAEIRHRWPSTYHNLDMHMFTGDPRTRKMRGSIELSTRDLIKKRIKDLKLDKQVHLERGLPQEQLRYYYAAADVVVMPSTYEPFGMVAIEAMATGTPVVASNVGGLKWTIEDGLTGFHAQPDKPVSFARAMVKILKDPKLAERLRENALIRTRRNFAWPLIAEKVDDLYKRAIEKNKVISSK